MPKCCKTGCDTNAEDTLKLEFYAKGHDHGAIAFLKFPLCENHKLNAEEIAKLIERNWEYFMLGFSQLNATLRPSIELTKWGWRPWEEAEAFWKEVEGSKNTKRVSTH